MAAVVLGVSACQDDPGVTTAIIANTARSTAAPGPGTSVAPATELPAGPGSDVPDAPGSTVSTANPDQSAPVTRSSSRAPVTGVPAVTACARVTREELHQILINNGITPKVVLGEPQCVQSWAMVWSQHTDAVPQSTGYLLHPDVQGFWKLVAQGSAISCTSAYQVPWMWPRS